MNAKKIATNVYHKLSSVLAGSVAVEVNDSDLVIMVSIPKTGEIIYTLDLARIEAVQASSSRIASEFMEYYFTLI